MLALTQLWKIPKPDYMLNPRLVLSYRNLVQARNIPAASIQAQADEQKILKLMKEVPEFLETLLPSQRKVLQSVLDKNIPLIYFFACVNERQLTDFSVVHSGLEESKQTTMRLLSERFPLKLVIQLPKQLRKRMFDYKMEAIKNVAMIEHVQVFYYLTELPLEFTDGFSVEQINRFGTLVKLVQDLCQSDDGTANQSSNSIAQNELSELKLLFAQFLAGMSTPQLFQIINLYPFLLLEEDLAAKHRDPALKEMDISVHQLDATTLHSASSLRTDSQIDEALENEESSQDQQSLDVEEEPRETTHKKRKSKSPPKRNGDPRASLHQWKPQLSLGEMISAELMRSQKRKSILLADPNQYFAQARRKEM
jgi:hypothetical protein